MPPSRRSCVASLAGLTAGALGGCLSDVGGRTTGGSTATAEAETATSPPDGRSALRLVPLDEVPSGPSLRVYPWALARLLERGADADGPVRTHDRALLEGQRPLLPRFSAVRFAGERVPDGAYALDLSGGPRYRWLFAATAVEAPPEGATVLGVSDLPADRRALALEAIEGDRPSAYPETPLGTWARTAFVGGYLRHEGTVYRGRELRQTDAAFFAEDVWYVGRVAPTDEVSADAPRLLLDPLPRPARRVVDDLLAAWAEQLDPVETDVSDLDESARAALAATDGFLTHVAAFECLVV